LVATAYRTEYRRGIEADRVEADVGGAAAVDQINVAALDARLRRLEEEQRDAGVCARRDDQQIGIATVEHETLGAVQHEAIGARLRLRCDRGRLMMSLLVDRQCDHDIACVDSRQPLLLLTLAASAR